jgi:hypothetical protein
MEGLNEKLLEAVRKRVEIRTTPVAGAVEDVRRWLDPYLTHARRKAEHDVHTEVFSVLGHDPLPPPEDDPSALHLRSSLRALLSLLGDLPEEAPAVADEPPQDAPVVPEPVPQEAPAVPVILRAVPRPAELSESALRAVPSNDADTVREVIVRHVPTRAEIAKAEALLAEFEKADAEDHALRLQPMLQAIVAEARQIMGHIEMDHPVHRRLERLMQRIDGFVRGLPEEIGFIKGLSPTFRDNWHLLAQDARRRLQRFDRDAAQAPAGPRVSRPAKEKERAESPVTYDWPELPNLRKRIEDAGLYLVGGLRREEKIELVKERFGIEPGWFSIDNGSSKDIKGVVKRVRAGRIGAIVFLEGLTSHNAWYDVQAACKATNTPFAAADKAGVASIADALNDIERQLSGKPAAAAAQ